MKCNNFIVKDKCQSNKKKLAKINKQYVFEAWKKINKIKLANDKCVRNKGHFVVLVTSTCLVDLLFPL